MKKLRFIQSISLASALLFCAGCEHGYDVTDREPFSHYVRRDLALKRTTFLWKEKGFPHGWLDMTDIANPVFQDVDVRRGDVQHVATLPSGTIIQLRQVARNWDGEAGVADFVAWGDVTLPHTMKRVEFKYFWGLIDAIDRAPWDDETVPPKRYVGKDGRSFMP
jgi:hypothetical protein